MTVIEAPIETPVPTEGIIDDGNVDEFYAHLYINPEVTLCGRPPVEDKHNGMHKNHSWAGAGSTCPGCGATICPDCEAEAIDKYGERKRT